MTEDELRTRFDARAVNALIALLNSGEAPEIDPKLFQVQLVEAGVEADAALLLDAAAEAALVERISVWRCPNRACGGILDVDDIANQACPHCHTDFRETGDFPVEGVVYRSLMAVSRSVSPIGSSTMHRCSSTNTGLCASAYCFAGGIEPWLDSSASASGRLLPMQGKIRLKSRPTLSSIASAASYFDWCWKCRNLLTFGLAVS
jgi:hypothetical protein